jgi:ABC-2 type transport system ATP-binding protein
MNAPQVVEVENLSHAYGARKALRGIDFGVGAGEIFGLLGPNGGGKTTLFRILATLLRPAGGRARVLGHDVVREPDQVRAGIGVVFQSPALDRKLTVRENLLTQGQVYGMRGATLRDAVDEMLRRVRLADRAGDRVESLSGGLMRRAEIAKGLLHRPGVLLLDEPSTGLDPGARQDLWEQLRGLQSRDGVTVLITTHLMEEAERCDRLAILSEGSLVACGTPRQLKDEIGGDVIVVAAPDPAGLKGEIERIAGGTAMLLDGTLRLERPRGHELVPRIMAALGDRIDSVTLGRPTLLDVFVHRTGHRFWGEGAE